MVFAWRTVASTDSLAISIGDRRLRLPEPNNPYVGVLDATVYGPACPQHRPGGFPIPAAVGSDVLDLFVNTSAKYLAEGRARWIDSAPDSGPESEDCKLVLVNAEVRS